MTNTKIQANEKKESIYQEKTFRNLISSLNEIKEKTKLESKGLLNEDNKILIQQTMNAIESETNYAPSFKSLINSILSKSNIDNTTQKIIKNLRERNISGYSPDIQTIVNETINQETITEVKEKIIEKLKLLDDI